MYDILNIFDTFLPQLLLYPNPTDPLNNEAASLQLKSEDQYNEKIKEYIEMYASDHLSKLKPIEDDAQEENKGGEQVHTNHSSEGKQKNRDRIDSAIEEQQMMDAYDSGDEIKHHESELSETSDIEMMQIDDEDNECNQMWLIQQDF